MGSSCAQELTVKIAEFIIVDERIDDRSANASKKKEDVKASLGEVGFS